MVLASGCFGEYWKKAGGVRMMWDEMFDDSISINNYFLKYQIQFIVIFAIDGASVKTS